MKNTAFSPITETCGAKLVDGWLCKDCASKLRIKYPMYYEKDKKYFYEKEGDSYVRVKSEDGGRPVLTAIKNELFYTDEYSIIDNSTTSYTEHLNFDPLAKLTSSQVRTELASIGSYRKETRQKFAGAKNAYESAFRTSSATRARLRSRESCAWARSARATWLRSTMGTKPCRRRSLPQGSRASI